MSEGEEHEGLEGLLQRATPAADLGARQSLAALEARLFGKTTTLAVGRYELRERLAAGGGGAVYVGHDPDHELPVAIKLLHTGHEHDESPARTRLLREAQSLAKLSHPNIIAVHDVGEYDPKTLRVDEIPSGGRGVFVVMEYVQGQTLDDWWSATSRPWQDVLAVMRAAGDALATAHEHGIIHRDFKPANVMIRDPAFDGEPLSGRVRVLDFGLAKVAPAQPQAQPQPLEQRIATHALGLGAQPLDVSLTATGTLLGTPAYMAPEQHERRKVDARADQYSFCLTLYEGWFGHSAIPTGSRAEIEAAKRQGRLLEPRSVPSIPARLVQAMQRGLAPEPEDRFDSMRALLDALRPPSRRFWPWVAGALVLASVGVAWVGSAAGLDDDACRSAARDARALWSSDTRRRVTTALRGVDAPWSDHTADAVGARMDAWTDTHAAAVARACHATTHDEATTRCFEAAARRAQALVRRLAEPDPKSAQQAIDAVAGLPDTTACLPPTTDDPGDTLRAAVANARHHRTEGDPFEAIRQLESLRDSLAQSPPSVWYPAVLAELALAQRRAGLSSEAHRSEQAALASAERIYGPHHPRTTELESRIARGIDPAPR